MSASLCKKTGSSKNAEALQLLDGGRYWVRTSDLFRVKEALLPLS